MYILTIKHKKVHMAEIRVKLCRLKIYKLYTNESGCKKITCIKIETCEIIIHTNECIENNAAIRKCICGKLVIVSIWVEFLKERENL